MQTVSKDGRKNGSATLKRRVVSTSQSLKQRASAGVQMGSNYGGAGTSDPPSRQETTGKAQMDGHGQSS